MNDGTSPSSVRPAPCRGAVVPGRHPWRFDAKLGEGAVGEVWRILHPETGRFEALKLARTEEARAHLTREAAVLSRLHERLGPCRNLVRLFATQPAEAPAWIALDYLPGRSLAERLAPRAAPAERLEPQKRLPIFRAICDGLAAAHHVDVVHGDLKPSNILLDFDLTPVIGDFGAQLSEPHELATVATVADATQASIRPSGLGASATSLATRGYASPERRDGQPPSPADDVYALGVLLFQLLLGDTSRFPDYPRETLEEEAPQPPGEALIELVEACLAHPKRRLPSAAAVRIRLPETVASTSAALPPEAYREPLLARHADAPSASAAAPTENGGSTTWLVDPSGAPCPRQRPVCTSLGEALAHAVEGDVICLRPGRYYEHIEITRRLRLVAELQGRGPRRPGESEGVVLHGTQGPCVTVAASGVSLEGLELRSGSGGPALVVREHAKRVRLLDCRLVRLREPLAATSKTTRPPVPGSERHASRDPQEVGLGEAERVGFVATLEGEWSSLTLRRCVITGSLRLAHGKLSLVECDLRVDGEPALHASQFARVHVIRSRFASTNVNRAKDRTAGIEACGPGCQLHLKQGHFRGFYVHLRLAGLGTRMSASDCDFAEAGHTAVEVQDAAEAYLRRTTLRDSRLFHVNVYDGGHARLTRCSLGGEASAGVRTASGGWGMVQGCRFDKLVGVPLLREPGSELQAQTVPATPTKRRRASLPRLAQFAGRLLVRGLAAIFIVSLYAAVGAVLGFSLAGLPALIVALHLGWQSGNVLLYSTLAGAGVSVLGALIALSLPSLRYLRPRLSGWLHALRRMRRAPR